MGQIDALAGMRRMQARSTNAVGMCLKTVYEAYGSRPSIGPGQGRFGVALAGWNYSTKKHPGDKNPPAGVPVYFGVSPTRTDKNKSAGDVAISLGGGRLIATDYPGAGRIGVTTIEARIRQTARPYLGWTGDFLGHDLVNIGATSGAAPASGGVGISAADQALLNKFGYGLATDGKNGPKSKAAVADFQRKNGLVADGIFGPKTRAKANSLLAAPAAPAAGSDPLTLAAQKKLKGSYPAYAGKLATDGRMGPATRAAIKEFQRRSGLVADGILGPKTRAKLGI